VDQRLQRLAVNLLPQVANMDIDEIDQIDIALVSPQTLAKTRPSQHFSLMAHQQLLDVVPVSLPIPR
jgi:hypothetical protein